MRSTLVPMQRTYTPVPEGPVSVADWLEYFGSMSPDEIAHHFRKAGILGTPRDPHDCGFAVFFRRVVGQRGIHVDGRGVVNHLTGEQHPMPASCRAFVSAFDHGHYPYLYREGAHRYAADPIKSVAWPVPVPVSKWTPTADTVTFELPADFWDRFVAKFKDIESAHELTYFGVPVTLINPAPVKLPELVGA
jgi:hypothetical protein